ncbi:MAG: hypothetical protein Kow00107_09720 [Planctomycetota bacterium]
MLIGDYYSSNTISLSYGGNGFLSTVTDATGRSFSPTYTVANLVEGGSPCFLRA